MVGQKGAPYNELWTITQRNSITPCSLSLKGANKWEVKKKKRQWPYLLRRLGGRFFEDWILFPFLLTLNQVKDLPLYSLDSIRRLATGCTHLETRWAHERSANLQRWCAHQVVFFSLEDLWYASCMATDFHHPLQHNNVLCGEILGSVFLHFLLRW